MKATGTAPSTSPKSGTPYHLVTADETHGRGIYETICLANDFDPGSDISGVFGASDWRETRERFPAGQIVALAEVEGKPQVIGVALSMRTSYAPSEKPLSWREMIGDLTLQNHDPGGRWLYGVEKAVHPAFQRLGVGSALYRAQFTLVKQLGLRGIYAGGMLKGYKAYKRAMSLRDYAGRVMRGELFDPTVSVQMRKGFKPRSLIENYAWDHEAGHAGVLIVWETRPGRRRVRSEQALSALR